MQETKVSTDNIPTRRSNNFIENNINIPKQIKYLIILELLVGINRLSLVCNNKLLVRLSYIYSVCVTVFTVCFRVVINIHSAIQLVFNTTVAVEYLVLNVSGLYKNKLLSKLFDDLQLLDDTFSKRHIYGFIVIFCYDIIEFVFNHAYFYEANLGYGSKCAIFIALITHDIEILFFCSVLIIILSRVELLKERVSEKLIMNKELTNVVENNITTEIVNDVPSFYKEYDLLHKCSKQCNESISLSIIAMLISSGVCTVLIMKNVIEYTNLNDPQYYGLIIMGTSRCLKYTFLIIALCYYSVATASQVVAMQSILQDTLNTKELSKVERRNLKAFLQLIRDNEINYVLGGVVKLNMTLPLNYFSLCTTYLLIVIQFSKFLE